MGWEDKISFSGKPASPAYSGQEQANIGKEIIFSKVEKEFLEEKLAAMREGQLSEGDFSKFTDEHGETYGLYDESKVLEDKKKVEDLRTEFEKKKKFKLSKLNLVEQEKYLEKQRVSQYFEAFIYDKVGGSNGMIQNSAVFKTTEADDFMRHVDFVLEHEDEHFGIAADVTLLAKEDLWEKGLKEKLDLFERDIQNNNLVQIEYFENLEGEPLRVPRVIIAIEASHARQMLKWWANEDKMLEAIPIKLRFLMLTHVQLKAGYEYSKSFGESHKKTTRIIKGNLDAIEDKLVIFTDVISHYQEKFENDDAYRTISLFCKNLINKAKQNKPDENS